MEHPAAVSTAPYRLLKSQSPRESGISAPNPKLRHCFDKLDQELKSWVEEAKLAA